METNAFYLYFLISRSWLILLQISENNQWEPSVRTNDHWEWTISENERSLRMISENEPSVRTNDQWEWTISENERSLRMISENEPSVRTKDHWEWSVRMNHQWERMISENEPSVRTKDHWEWSVRMNHQWERTITENDQWEWTISENEWSVRMNHQWEWSVRTIIENERSVRNILYCSLRIWILILICHSDCKCILIPWQQFLTLLSLFCLKGRFRDERDQYYKYGCWGAPKIWPQSIWTSKGLRSGVIWKGLYFHVFFFLIFVFK